MKSSPFKILLVDDRPGYLHVQARLASPDGHEEFMLGWVSAYDPAIQAVQHGEWDAVLVSQRIDGHPGLEFIHHARLCRADVPIVLLAELEDHPLDYKSRKVGATDCIAKDELNRAYLKGLLASPENHPPREPKKLPGLSKLLDFSIKLGPLDQRA